MLWLWVNFQCQGILLIWITVRQRLTVLAVGAGGACLNIFSLVYHFSLLSPSFWEMARYRLKYCLTGPCKPKQPTNQYKQHRLCLTVRNSMLDMVLFSFCSIPRRLSRSNPYSWHWVCLSVISPIQRGKWHTLSYQVILFKDSGTCLLIKNSIGKTLWEWLIGHLLVSKPSKCYYFCMA